MRRDSEVRGVLAVASLLLASCSSGSGERVDSRSSEIIGGSLASNTADSGVVFIKGLTNIVCEPDNPNLCRYFYGYGTGQLVAPDLVLTAAHVLDHVDPKRELTVRLGSAGSSGEELRFADQIFRHHSWNQDTHTGTDVALIKLSTPFTHGRIRALSTKTSLEILAYSQLLCRGYGQVVCPAPKDPYGFLKEILLTPNAIAPDGLIELRSSTIPASVVQGDSGGPCIDTDGAGDVQGVIVSADCGIRSDILPPTAFKYWYDRVFDAIWTVVADFNGNGLPDTGALVRRQNDFAIRFVFDNNTSIEVAVPIPFPGFQDVQFFAGQFNADPFADVVLLVDNKPYYLDFNPTSLFSVHSDVSFGVYDHLLPAGDFDGDGFDDMVGVDASGFEDIYYGSSTGLRAGKPLGTFPKGQDNDGRFLLLSGTDEATLPVPQMSALVISDATEPELSVELFDGKFGSGYDRGAGDSCYELRTDPFGDGAPGSGTLVRQLSDDDFPENGWRAIYRGPQHPDAQGFSGAPYVYRLDMTLGACGGPAEPVGGNALKIRSTSALAFARDELSFWARDGFGPWLPPGGFIADYNAEYDGTFSWYVDVSNASEVTLIDADADRTPDDDVLSPYRCDPLTPDVQNDGREVIANDIYYQLFEYQDGSLLATNSNPSGNYWDAFNEYDQECRQFPLPPFPGVVSEDDVRFIEWRWSNVLSGNQVHIKIPQGSPTYLRLLARPESPPSLTSAMPSDDWLANAAGISFHLPLLLGERDGCGRLLGDSRYVHTKRQAKRILEGRSGFPLGRPTLIEQTRAELLSLKLNLARALTLGDPVANAWVYGTEMTVSELVDAADHAFSHRCIGPVCRHWHGCGSHGLPDSERTTRDELREVLRNLRAVNAGRITYVTPDFNQFAPQASSRAAPKASSSSLVEEQGSL